MKNKKITREVNIVIALIISAVVLVLYFGIKAFSDLITFLSTKINQSTGISGFFGNQFILLLIGTYSLYTGIDGLKKGKHVMLIRLFIPKIIFTGTTGIILNILTCMLGFSCLILFIYQLSILIR